MKMREKLKQFQKKMKDPTYRKKMGKKAFWAFIIYHIIKGLITTTFIWIPLIYLWWKSQAN